MAKSGRMIKAPLFTDWREQYATLAAEGLRPGEPAVLRIDGKPADFQYTGAEAPGGAEVVVRLGFDAGKARTLEFAPAEKAGTDLRPVEVAATGEAEFGVPGRLLRLPAAGAGEVRGPFGGYAGFTLDSRIVAGFPLLSRRLTRTCDGPLFVEYLLDHAFEANHYYRLRLRCYRHEPIVEVAEQFFLGPDAGLVLTLNPERAFDTILSHRSFDFEGEAQPTIEPIDRERPKDVLCRLQIPVLNEYTVPNNRGWFAFFDSRDESRGMLGLMGLYGGRWKYPVDNMMKVQVKSGLAELHANLGSGERFWLLYAGPVDKTFAPDRPQVFHRFQAEFNALRLDEHLDLGGDEVFDASCWDKPGFFGEGFRERARRNIDAYPPLKAAVDKKVSLTLQALLDPRPETQRPLADDMTERCERWVRQFQGIRIGQHDYAKSVIGFSRRLRGILVAYELLRKDRFLTEEQARRMGAWFVFAARRICDEGRWPHSKTHLHPDHPESVRDFYAYPGEHKPDRLVWTNSLPNFQSDPLCALVHIAATIPDHPDAALWQRKALDGLEDQLNAYCGATGAWEESINYALYTFCYFTLTFRAVRNRLGVDFFHDERFRRYACWLARYAGPFDVRFGAWTWPGVGNSILPQNGADSLLAFAGELVEGDPLRADLIAVYDKMEPHIRLAEHAPVMVAEMAPLPRRHHAIRPLRSEHMPEVGVAFRHDHTSPKESYLFQKIGFAKDHYEADETCFNWYAKGTPLMMDYGTYSHDAGAQGAHNLVEIPDADNVRRGYLAEARFSPVVDYTRCEQPITLKLFYGRLRSFADIDGPPQQPLFFYIGDENPVGPKTWKRRLLLFVKPDYLVLFDRVIGPVPHRYNLHATADAIERDGRYIRGRGRFDLDLLCFVQHPAEFEFATGELVPNPQRCGEGAANPHRQRFARIYNTADGVYRTVLFAQERGRAVRIEPAGAGGVRVATPEYTDYVFIGDEAGADAADSVRFRGRVGWIRQAARGEVMACVPDGDGIEGFGTKIDGRGPWTWNMDGRGGLSVEGVPRLVKVSKA